ncbi:DUF5304 family protein [Actinospica durhamensis]|uniref:DUF5304 family protein n=1 Tax=Actinospica durhamensis TaxID=1508375 RepID=A0A941ENB2_9ACTN|nr:DUF5304 family protein [Actinospica durhamensis]MBR7832179.1 DUF5304 family protein [Actinospica durhamensis]
MTGSADDDEFDIPVTDSLTPAPTGRARNSSAPEHPGDATDWTRAHAVRDDPESLGDEARKLWDAVRTQFVEPLLRNYPEAAGHLSSAGGELASAVRSLIRGSEQVWAGPGARAEDPAQAADVVDVLDDEAPDGDAEHPTQG